MLIKKPKSFLASHFVSTVDQGQSQSCDLKVVVGLEPLYWTSFFAMRSPPVAELHIIFACLGAQ
jgi:Ni,Fe-hydrogenase III small subunit